MYQVHTNTMGHNIIVIEQDGVRASFNENYENTDYQLYLAWLEEGNEPEIDQP